jgi:hypothetical protein
VGGGSVQIRRNINRERERGGYSCR